MTLVLPYALPRAFRLLEDLTIDNPPSSDDDTTTKKKEDAPRSIRNVFRRGALSASKETEAYERHRQQPARMQWQ
jgi:hypothetical protein